MKQFTASVGKNHEQITFKHFSRSNFQWNFIKKLAKRKDFDFFCSRSLFDKLTGKDKNYHGYMAVMWFSKRDPNYIERPTKPQFRDISDIFHTVYIDEEKVVA